MNEFVREKLILFVERYGSNATADAKLCENFLRDVCGAHKREISILVAAARDRIPHELLSFNHSIPIEIILSKLAKRLHTNLGLTDDAARWCVESWSLALKLTTVRHLYATFHCPSCGVTGQVSRLSFGETSTCSKCRAALKFTETGVARLRQDQGGIRESLAEAASLSKNPVGFHNGGPPSLNPQFYQTVKPDLIAAPPQIPPPALITTSVKPTAPPALPFNRPMAKVSPRLQDLSTERISPHVTAANLQLARMSPPELNADSRICNNTATLRARAKSQVMLPGGFLIAIALITTLFHVTVIYMCFSLSEFAFAFLRFVDTILEWLVPLETIKQEQRIFRILISIVGLQLGIFQLVAGIRLITLNGYALAIFACLFSMVPYLSPAFILGLPLLAWTLTAISYREVRHAYTLR